ncbi:MAG: HEAT repeat domain-containing protein [Planctomycetota bacterium]
MALFRRKKKKIDRRVDFLVRSQDLDALLEVLEQPSLTAMEANAVVQGFIAIDNADAWDALGNVLSTAQIGTLEGVINQLAVLESNGALRAMGDALGNPNPFLRGAVITGLSTIGASAVLPHLLRAARDPQKSLSQRASRIILRRIERQPNILAGLNNATAEGIISLMDDRWTMELMSDKFPESVRMIAARRLGIIGGEESSQALASLVQRATGKFGDACWSALEACHHVSDFVLLPLLVDPRPEIKARVLPIYAKHADATSGDILVGLVGDATIEVRMAALKAFASVAGDGALQTLELALDDIEDDVRNVAIDLLCGIKDSSPELVRIVRTQDGEVRRRALSCLANRGVVHNELLQPYIEFLYQGSSCTDLKQREYLDSLAVTAKTLGQACNEEALKALMALGKSVIRRLRRAAIEGLMCYPPEMRADALFSLMDTHDTDMIRNVAFGLAEAQDERALLPLIRTAMECRGKPMVKAKEALKNYEKVESVDFLIECLTSGWSGVRKFGAEKLKDLEDPKSIPALLTASQDENVDVQLAVFEAIGPFAAANEAVTKRMLDAIAYGDISVRQQACESLGEARCKEAVPDLVKALSNCFLRPRASEALKRIGDRKGYLALKRLEIRERLFKRVNADPSAEQH